MVMKKVRKLQGFVIALTILWFLCTLGEGAVRADVSSNVPGVKLLTAVSPCNLLSIDTADTATMETTIIGSIGYGAEAFSFSPTGVLFASTESYCAIHQSADFLMTVSTTTGAGTIIGPIGFGDVDSIAFSPDGTLYGVDTFTDNLIKINPTTGLGTIVGPVGFPVIEAMDFSPDGTLFATDVSSPQGGPSTLLKIDTTTGSGTAIGSIGFNTVSGIAFASDGTLFGVSCFLGGGTGQLITINPVTGAGTALMQVITSGYMDGLEVIPSCTTPPPNLVSWWPGDGNANDIVDGNHGTLQGGATYGTGLVGQAFSLDGIDDFVEIGAPTNLNTLSSITLGAWIYRLGPGTGAYPYLNVIVGKAGLGGYANSDAWYLRWYEGKPQFIVVSDDNHVTDLRGPVLPDGVWHYVTGTFDETTQRTRLYVNSVMVAEGTTTSGLASNSVPVRIGMSSHWYATEPFNGIIDEVQVYNRALTPSEIESIYNAGSVGKCKIPPDAPSPLTAKATSSSSIALTWKDNSNNETGFKIQRKLGACASLNTWSQIATKGANVISHTNTGLTANTTYSYRVRAYNAVGNSAYSNCASAKTASSGTPKAPTNLNATSLSVSQIGLIWTDNSTNETSFEVFRKVGSGSWNLLTTKGANVVSHTNSTATGNTSTTTYSYYLQACNSSGCSPATNYAVVPYKPINLNATAVSASRINLAWTDKSSNETGFQIYRKSGVCSSPSDWGLIATKGANSTSHSNTGLSSVTTYSYRVRAYKKSLAMPYAYGYSSYSNCKSATTP